MPRKPSAGLLAVLLSLPSLALAAPPAGAEPSPTNAMEARLQRLTEAIRARADALEPERRQELEREGWLLAGAWWNGNNRGWANRGWPNRVFGGSSEPPPRVWANFRPGWGNFRNGPRFINW
ncbi:MAG: GrrA/OscA1 family cyclophane-containing rSAM-modified RiPP [Cyanobacteriota bacterium]|jgi:rSAM-associated Gly-rich repeat protein